jgi:hypothetical protein
MQISMAIYMPGRKRKSSQENEYIIQDIVPGQENGGLFPVCTTGEISDEIAFFQNDRYTK